MEPAAATTVDFGRFRLRLDRRVLLANDVIVPLGGRAFDVLCLLVSAAGRPVSKDELIATVWAGRIVEDNSVEAQIHALRKALGRDKDLIRTAAGRGYFFAGERVERPAVATNLRPHASEMIDRAEVETEVSALLTSHRLVTLTGAGGIGKTSLAIAVAGTLMPRFADGVWLVELDMIADPALVVGTVAAALGELRSATETSDQRLVEALAAKNALIVLDNCEHVIGAAAAVVDLLVRACPGILVLATSREPLRVQGERVFQVPRLIVPDEAETDIAALLETPAVRLFLTRASARGNTLEVDHLTAAAVGDICRHLDGIPLAIEMAAASATIFGVAEVARRLDDRFRLLTDGLRTALPRQQTLEATLAWSHALLTGGEQQLFRALALMAGPFTPDAALAVGQQPMPVLAALVAKSLVSAETRAGQTYFRLLETTRAYAIDRLAEAGEGAEIARRHARHFLAVFEVAEAEWEVLSSDLWLARYAPHLSNARAALDWAFSPAGDAAIGAALTAALTPLLFQLSLIHECLSRVRQALTFGNPGGEAGDRREMKLLAALGSGLMYTKGPGAETRDAFSATLAVAERLQDADYQLRALWGLSVIGVNTGQHRQAIGFVQRFSKIAVARDDLAEILVGARLTGAILHVLGDQIGAADHLERVLHDYVPPPTKSPTIRFQFDQRVATQAFLARVLWLRGEPARARELAEAALSEALALDHKYSICHALAQAVIPVTYLNGDLTAAAAGVAQLLDYADRHGLGVWSAWAKALDAILKVRQGDTATSLGRLETVVADHQDPGISMYHARILGELAVAQARAGKLVEAGGTIRNALGLAHQREELWCLPELLRVEGELRLEREGVAVLPAVLAQFEEAMALAHRQGALSWELRIALSLCRLQPGPETLERLRLLLNSLSETRGTDDLEEAQALLIDAYQAQAKPLLRAL